jgi:transaldolase
MKLFADTGNLKELEPLASLGILDGVTTNPSLMAKEGGDPRQILKQICRLVQGPVSAEVVATDAAGMIREGRELAAIDEHIVVKVPFTKDGVKACKTLASEGKRVNVTLIFSATQAWLAAKVGAAYVSPFVGRLDDVGTTGMNLVREIVDIFDNYEFGTEVLVASVRHPIHIVESARMGADVVTCPPAVIEQSFKHPLTDIGLAKFLADWEKAQAASANCTAAPSSPAARRGSSASATAGGSRPASASTRCSTPAPSKRSTSSSPTAAATSGWPIRSFPVTASWPGTGASTGGRCVPSRRTSPCSAARCRRPTAPRSRRSWTWP